MKTFWLSCFLCASRCWARILLWRYAKNLTRRGLFHLTLADLRAFKTPPPRPCSQRTHPCEERPSRTHTRKQKIPAYWCEKLWSIRIFCRCCGFCVKEPSAARNQQSPGKGQKPWEVYRTHLEAPPHTFHRSPYTFFWIMCLFFFSVWEVRTREGFTRTSSKQDREGAGGDGG